MNLIVIKQIHMTVLYGQYSMQRQADRESELVRHVENLSNATLYRIIVENKFQPPANEKNIISYGVDH